MRQQTLRLTVRVLYRHPATAAQGILLRLGQGYETLTTMDHIQVRPALKRQAEVKVAVLQLLPCHGDRFTLEQGEIGNAQNPSAVLLQADDLLSGAAECRPLFDAALEGAFAPVPLLTRPDLL
jgi:hypothetical protein